MRRYVKASQKNKTTTNTQCATCVAYLFAGTARGILVQEGAMAHQAETEKLSRYQWRLAATISGDTQPRSSQITRYCSEVIPLSLIHI